ncbi:MAG: ABC transporter permease [Thermoanaerobaculales bacterium]|nr:ABC transporter permease [Thermoanaerobaculales bacterium]
MANQQSAGQLEQFIDTTRQDIRFALRQIARRPGFSFLVALTLAIGIGGCTAIFSVLKGVVLRDLPYPEPERLVAVWEKQNELLIYQPFSGPDYLDLRAQSTTLQEVGILTGRWFNLAGDGEPVRLPGARCTASLLHALGVQPLHGRLFVETEEVENANFVVILSHRLWQSRFGGDPDALKRTILVDGVPHEVVGIMPAAFEFPTPWGGRDTAQIWAPLVTPHEDSHRSWHSFGAVGRLADGATPAEVDVELESIAAELAATYPDSNAHTAIWAEPLMKRTLSGVQKTMTFLLIVVSLVLLIACANIASMLLARGAQRTPEIAIRSSVGADRTRLLRQLLTESLIQSIIGGAAGLALAIWIIDALAAILPPSIPRVAGIEIDLPVLVFAAATTIAAGLLAGLAPAIFAARTEIAAVLREGLLARGGSRGLHRFLGGLVAAQIAVGLVLVNTAVVLVISYSNVVSQEMNFGTDEVLVSGVSLRGPAYESPEQRRAFYDELSARVRALPGVAAVGFTDKLPLRGGSNADVLVKDEIFDPSAPAGSMIEHSFVDDGYFEAMEIPVLSGRTFDAVDLERASAAAGHEISPVELPLVINRTMAEQMWPGENPVGQLVRPRSAIESYQARVIGIVEDVRQWGAERPPLPEMYFPYTCEIWGPPWANLVVRAGGEPTGLTSAIRETVRRIDSRIPVADSVTMAEILRQSTGRRRFTMLLMALFAATALALIVAGIYGVMSYSISQRTHEIGVRMALGADTISVARHFFGRSARLFGPGLAIGLIGSLAASGLTRSMVFGISPMNPAYVTAAVAAMIVVTAAAVTVPVLRATRVNPTDALKVE